MESQLLGAQSLQQSRVLLQQALPASFAELQQLLSRGKRSTERSRSRRLSRARGVVGKGGKGGERCKIWLRYRVGSSTGGMEWFLGVNAVSFERWWNHESGIPFLQLGFSYLYFFSCTTRHGMFVVYTSTTPKKSRSRPALERSLEDPHFLCLRMSRVSWKDISLSAYISIYQYTIHR